MDRPSAYDFDLIKLSCNACACSQAQYINYTIWCGICSVLKMAQMISIA